jgi:hypothetical protein
MALKEIDITVTEGRDAGKTFHVKEWACIKTEHWIMRVVLGLGKAGVEIPLEILQLGAGPTAYAIASQVVKLPAEEGIKLADELMDCVTIVEQRLTRKLIDEDIEDVSTRLLLKGEVLKLLFGFFVPAASQTSAPVASPPAGK